MAAAQYGRQHPGVRNTSRSCARGFEPGTHSGSALSPALPGQSNPAERSIWRRRDTRGTVRLDLAGRTMLARHDSCPYGGARSGDWGWLVVQTKRHKERTVQAILARDGVPTYLPLLRQWPRPAVGGDVGPMFPG